MATTKDTYRYYFKLGNRIVYAGITNDIYRRAAEHLREPGHAKGHVKQIGLRIRYSLALEWRNEQEKLGRPIFK